MDIMFQKLYANTSQFKLPSFHWIEPHGISVILKPLLDIIKEKNQKKRFFINKEVLKMFHGWFPFIIVF